MEWGATTRLLSPTYVLVRRHQRHQDDLLLYHIDLYRLTSIVEIEMLGLDEMLDDPRSSCLVEWPDRHPGLFDEEYLWIHFHMLDAYRRSLMFRAYGERHQAILDHFRQELLGL